MIPIQTACILKIKQKSDKDNHIDADLITVHNFLGI